MNPERAAQITDEIEFLRGIAAKLKTFGMRHNDEIAPMSALFAWFADRAQDAFDQGVDWAYEPERLEVKVYETRYLGEKWSRVFGRFLGSHRPKQERQAHVEMFLRSAKWLTDEPPCWRKAPSAPGYYWWRGRDDDGDLLTTIVHVWLADGEMHWDAGDTAIAERGDFFGPLEPPP